MMLVISMAQNHKRPSLLGVYLVHRGKELRVGELTRSSTDEIEFIFATSYIDLGPERPILSCRWHFPGDEKKTRERMADARHTKSHGGLLPSWFDGLLPEGALFEIVTRQMGTGRYGDFDVLARLGADLPGAVVIRPEDVQVEPAPAETGEPPIRFSLSGVQLKLSMRMAKDKVTLPMQDEAGDLIIKLPAKNFTRLPEAEYCAMTLARLAGVDTAEFDILPMAKLEMVPKDWKNVGEYFLAVKRFDRTPEGRIHIEDFAQIIGAVDDRKYTMSNDESNMKIAKRFCRDPVENTLQIARRLVVNILIGNNDAHLKNWSLIYDNPARPKLSPAYDVVPAAFYTPSGSMALELQGTRNPYRISIANFRRTAKFVDLAEEVLVREVRETVERAAELWPAKLKELPVDRGLAAMWKARWDKLTLTKAIKSPFADHAIEEEPEQSAAPRPPSFGQ